MKEITVGRGNDCDIIVDDDSDIVSRRHALIRFSFTGNMEICDVSQNGTYVNGERLEKDVYHAIQRDDSVSLAKIWDLDLKSIKNPYHITYIIMGILTFVTALVVALVLTLPHNKPTDNLQQGTNSSATMDSLSTKTESVAEDTPPDIQNHSKKYNAKNESKETRHKKTWKNRSRKGNIKKDDTKGEKKIKNDKNIDTKEQYKSKNTSPIMM